MDGSAVRLPESSLKGLSVNDSEIICKDRGSSELQRLSALVFISAPETQMGLLAAVFLS